MDGNVADHRLISRFPMGLKDATMATFEHRSKGMTIEESSQPIISHSASMKTPSRLNPVVFASGALAIAIYFFRLSDGGLRTGFSHDDLMNIWRAWQDP